MIGGVSVMLDMDPTILLVVLVGVALGLLIWITRPRVRWGATVLAELDAGDDLEGVSTSRLSRVLAYEFKAEFGEMRYNNANRIIAGGWVRQKLSEMKDLRKVDMVRHAEMAVELCLLPTAHAVRAAELAKMAEVRGRRAAVALAK
jgi:hypothetical protein